MSLMRVVSAAGEESIAYVVIQKYCLLSSMACQTCLKKSSPLKINLVRGNLQMGLIFQLGSRWWSLMADWWKGEEKSESISIIIIINKSI